jgi:PAS domain S-box-containing protein
VIAPIAYHERFSEVLRFARFGDADREVLAELAVHARPELERIARLFYERTREHERAHDVFEDEEQIARLHRSLVSWLERVLVGPYDEAYCNKTAQIGRRHVQVGLPQEYMFAAMSLFRSELIDIAGRHMAPRVVSAGQAVGRVLDAELAVMCLTYAEADAERRRRLEAHPASSIVAERYRSAVELDDGIVIGLATDGRILLFNRAAQEASGYLAADVLGERLSDLLLSNDDGDFAPWWDRAIHAAPGAAVACDVHLKTRSGKLREVAARLCRHTDPGDDLAVFLIGRDVTDTRALEAQLRRAEKLAAVGTLAAGLAHEIRNPLNGAHLHTTLLRRELGRGRASPEIVDAAEVVSREIQRLGDLVTEFLEFARPRPLHRATTSIQVLCAQSVELLEGEARASGVELTTQFPASPLEVSVDGPRLQQVMLNLLRNAVQAAAESGGGHVEVSVTRRPRSFVIEVADDGPGVPPEAPIFDAFYSTKEGGTGLGLAIVHRVVTDHGGRITLDSQPGNTVFHVELPLSDPGDMTPIIRQEKQS